MLNFCSGNGVDNDKSAGVHAEDDEKERLSLLSPLPSADMFISAETIMDAEETIDLQEAGEVASIRTHPGRSVIAHDDDDDDKSAEEPLLSPAREFAKNTPPEESTERRNCCCSCNCFCRLKSTLWSHSRAGNLSCLILQVRELHRSCSRALALASLRNALHLLLCKIATCITITLAMRSGSAMSRQMQQSTKTSN